MPNFIRMLRLMGIRGLLELAFFILGCWLLVMSQWYCDPLEDRKPSKRSNPVFPVEKKSVAWTGFGVERFDPSEKNMTLQQIVDKERKKIRNEMEDYEYPKGKYNISAEKLEDLMIEEGGKPVRSIILSTWRSGSTFLGSIIEAHPATAYHFEPLRDFDTVQVRGPPLDSQALFRIKSVLNCEQTRIGIYTRTGYYYDPEFVNVTEDSIKQCDDPVEPMYYDPELLSAKCKLYPFHTMKIVRLRLNIAKKLLADENLAVRMVLLVRDPRGLIHSRKRHPWCRDARDCFDPALICTDMVADYKDAVELRKKYPNTFRVIRYEDLSAAPYERAEELANFFGMGFHRNMKNYLDNHTRSDNGSLSPFDTFRDSKQTPYRWKKGLEFEKVDEIQRDCTAAMEYWGYLPALNSAHQKEFNPVTSYSLDRL